MARILVIDDEEVVQTALTQLLETDGHTVIQALDGAKGLSAFRESPVDIVIADIFMPEMEGLGTIRELRRMNHDVQIIAMSGCGTTQSTILLELASQLGANAALKKPFQMQELRNSVNSCLEMAGDLVSASRLTKMHRGVILY